jgi:hypothetical protein
LPIGSRCLPSSLVCTGSPDPRQRPFRPGRQPRIRPVMREPPAEQPASGLGFLLPFGCRPSLLGSSCARWGVESSSPSAYRITNGSPDPSGCRVSHEHDATGQDALFTPGTVMRSQPATNLRPAPAASQRPVPIPRLNFPPTGDLHEASSRVHSRSPITPAGGTAQGWKPAGSHRSSPRLCPPSGTGDLGLCTPSFAPQSPATHVRWRRALRTGPSTTPSASAERMSRSSLISVAVFMIVRRRSWVHLDAQR